MPPATDQDQAQTQSRIAHLTKVDDTDVARITQTPIDDLMERASRALEATDYYKAESLCLKALDRARRAHDFERMSRIIMPLQEARRQKRHLAYEAAEARGGPTVCRERPAVVEPGVYILEPPALGIDGRALRDTAEGRRVPAVVLTREPMTRDGSWPIVAVGSIPIGPGVLTLREKVAPPVPLERIETGIRKDEFEPPMLAGTDWAAWMQASLEALGDAAIRSVDAGLAPAWRVDELIKRLDAHPDHEKLHQALSAACREAMAEPVPTGERPRHGSNSF